MTSPARHEVLQALGMSDRPGSGWTVLAPRTKESLWERHFYFHGAGLGLYTARRIAGKLSRLQGYHTRPEEEIEQALQRWLEVVSRRRPEVRHEAEIADWFRTEELRVVKARVHGQGVRELADSRRLSHESLRRICWGAFLAVAATQFIYFVTGVTILHPVAAILVAGVSGSFYAMARLMRRELEQVLSE